MMEEERGKPGGAPSTGCIAAGGGGVSQGEGNKDMGQVV